jgi:hypothetical protein
MNNTIELYQSSDGAIQLDVKLDQDTVWLTQAQIITLFERDQSVISRHISNVFKEGELKPKSNMQKKHSANSDKPVTFYSLDMIISVGYRVKSPRGVQFRQWATNTLKQHLINGYTLNQQRIEFLGADMGQLLDLLQKTLARHELASPEGIQIVRLIGDYARSWTLLQAYDEQTLAEPDNKPDHPKTRTAHPKFPTPPWSPWPC